ncbi:S-adenosylmethionine:tRNA ribosyltransferase-isomerase [Pelotomaculum propionicicum]|uniref:S-adenosylmethionine:tRNA ribosyltransferase-isomerase n=2 Tax=Pelotomaculum propionicicum TaxID=258475 RepID=A0A4Y7RMB8_9FIRM|nr:S-adenosylmethionine:tRNA ribosyltransferase-isomerase [Pelotomaculum propionicicum]
MTIQMKTSDFDYALPAELIAQEPAAQRSASRLMVVRTDREQFEHRRFTDLVDYLKPGDTLVINDTKVIPARLLGVKEGTGARVEALLLKQLDNRRWEALVRPGKKIVVGTRLVFKEGLLSCEVLDSTGYGGRVLQFAWDGQFEEVLDQVGLMPVPPYIRKPLLDRDRYQTVYARLSGSAAAPTAGLHFSDELLSRIKDKGIAVAPVLLHVGLGTFRPVKVEDITRHRMHAEFYEVSAEAAEIISKTRERGGRVIAVGTTTTRCLESAAAADGRVCQGSGWTEIFIYPGYRFKAIDGMVTNFHLPRSTLLMMVAALAGREKILAAYQEAVEMRYRFFSFGDAMLII